MDVLGLTDRRLGLTLDSDRHYTRDGEFDIVAYCIDTRASLWVDRRRHKQHVFSLLVKECR